MHLSYAELQRSALDALRGLGLPFGQADDAVEGLLLAQVGHGAAYTLLREAEPTASSGWKPIRTGSDGTSLDLRGQTLLAFAARIADFAATLPTGTSLHVDNFVGAAMMPYICFRIARNGRSVAAAWSASTAADDHALARRQGGRVLVDAFGDRDAWLAASGLLPGVRLMPLSGQIAVGRADLALGDEASDEVFAGMPGSPVSLDLEDARVRALRDGLDVSLADHAFYKSLMTRIRIASSERSRTQAG